MEGQSPAQDKRRSVRITTRLLFSKRIVAASKFAAIRQDCDNGISMYNREELAAVQSYLGAQAALARLQEKDADLAAYLKHLDSKMDLLLDTKDSIPALIKELKLRDINISGHGLAYWTEEGHAVGDIVELHIVLPPENTYINCFCEVVAVTEEKVKGEKQHSTQRVSLKYALIMEHDQEALIQYNFKQQSLALQRRRLGREA